MRTWVLAFTTISGYAPVLGHKCVVPYPVIRYASLIVVDLRKYLQMTGIVLLPSLKLSVTVYGASFHTCRFFHILLFGIDDHPAAQQGESKDTYDIVAGWQWISSLTVAAVHTYLEFRSQGLFECCTFMVSYPLVCWASCCAASVCCLR